MSSEKIIGLIGSTLKHSFSSNYFADEFSRERISGFEYRNFELRDITEWEDLLILQPRLVYFNVTMPYKEQIIKYLHQIDEEAWCVGAVNFVWVERD